MHDTDMAGILYFPRQFRFVHDALEDFVETSGLTFEQVFRKEHFVFVIVHAEADYLAPLRVSDRLKIEVRVENIGETSFTMAYRIYKEGVETAAGTAKTVHVTLDSTTRKKISIPEKLKQFLSQHLEK
jgi:1,4-dihydroxy-2-naphthoyl-CoA hydrolase